MLNFCDFIQVYAFTTNHHLIPSEHATLFGKRLVDVVLFTGYSVT